jgi:hypothetical protein
MAHVNALLANQAMNYEAHLRATLHAYFKGSKPAVQNLVRQELDRIEARRQVWTEGTIRSMIQDELAKYNPMWGNTLSPSSVENYLMSGLGFTQPPVVPGHGQQSNSNGPQDSHLGISPPNDGSETTATQPVAYIAENVNQDVTMGGTAAGHFEPPYDYSSNASVFAGVPNLEPSKPDDDDPSTSRRGMAHKPQDSQDTQQNEQPHTPTESPILPTLSSDDTSGNEFPDINDYITNSLFDYSWNGNNFSDPPDQYPWDTSTD